MSKVPTVKVLKLYDAKNVVFNDLKILNAEIGEEKDILVNKSATFLREVNQISEKMFCTLCRCEFKTQTAQREHYKLDWHLFNLKRKFNGREPFSEEDFESFADEISSISGSDSEGSEHPEIPDSPMSSMRNSTEKVILKRKFPKIFFKNTTGNVFALYRCIVHGKWNEPTNGEEMAKMILKLHGAHHKWCILMTGGGHFAGAIFYREEVLVHKTFHRYTVRAKRGTSQGLHDAQHGHSKSAGANLRRHNEIALREEICDLLKTWRDDLKTCERIFIRAPSYDKSIFYLGKDPSITKYDQRLRSIPFATRRPTFKEVNRVYQELNTIFCYENEIDAFKSLPWFSEIKTIPDKTIMKPENKDNYLVAENKFSHQKFKIDEFMVDKNNSSSSEEIELFETTISTLHLKEFDMTKKIPRQKKKKIKQTTSINTTPLSIPQFSQTIERDSPKFFLCNQLYMASRSGDLDTLKLVLSPLLDATDTSELPTDVTATATATDSVEPFAELVTVEMLNNRKLFGGKTLLHVAARSGQPLTVLLLLEAGCIPSIRDENEQTAYAASCNKITRNAFRKFMALYPTKYNYSEAQIPGPLTKEMEEKSANKAAARKQAKRLKNKEKKAEQKRINVEEKEKQWFLSLSDREKRALAAERRFSQQQENFKRCWTCGEDLEGKTPFEYLDFKFCTIECLRKHKEKQKVDNKH